MSISIAAAETVLTRISPQLRRLGATAVETLHGDTIVASFSRINAPAAKAALRESVDGVNLLVRTEGGPFGRIDASLDDIGSFIAGGHSGPATGFGRAVENPTVLTIHVPNHAADGLRQVIRDTVNATQPVQIEYGRFMVPVA